MPKQDPIFYSASPVWRQSGSMRNWAVAWHGAWLALIVAAGLGLAAASPGQAGWIACVLAAAAAPAMAGLSLSGLDGARLREILLGIWAYGAGTAVVLTGGVSGPLAAWCLAPLAAAAILGGGRTLALGAALSLATLGVAATAERVGVAPSAPSGALDFWFGLLALGSTALGMGAALILGGRLAAGAGREAALMRGLLRTQPDLTLLLSPQGVILAAFGAGPTGLDLRLAQREGLGAALAIEDQAPLLEALAAALRAGSSTAKVRPAAAAKRVLEVRMRRHERQVVAVIRDVTFEESRQAQLEKARDQAEATAAGKTRFLANMSHELRTPLNAIMGFSDIMRSRMFGPLPERYAEYGELIHESGAHLVDLINDVLDMSKIEADRFELLREVFDAREAVAAALRLTRVQADSAGVKLRGMLPAMPLEVDADRRAIKQITLNLISNALKFTPNGGSVTVSAIIQDANLVLTVADTGVGIAPSDLERLGRPYEQAGAPAQRMQGTGLGLSLVRAFAELHGGEMAIESVVGEGTTVTVLLPVAVEPAAQPAAMGGNVVAFHAGR